MAAVPDRTHYMRLLLEAQLRVTKVEFSYQATKDTVRYCKPFSMPRAHAFVDVYSNYRSALIVRECAKAMKEALEHHRETVPDGRLILLPITQTNDGEEEVEFEIAFGLDGSKKSEIIEISVLSLVSK